MSSKNLALALLLLMAVVIGSCLVVYSYEPESSPELPVQEGEQNELNNRVESVKPALPKEEYSVPSEESSVPSVDEPIRNPLGDNREETPVLTVTVTDEDGYAIVGASVSVGELDGVTDSEGICSLAVVGESVTVWVKADGFVSYYEEFLAEELDGEMEIVLETADAIRKLLNSAKLRPYVFADPTLTESVDAILAEILTPGMDTYDKVKACYDWMVKNVSYKVPFHAGSGYWDCAYQVFRDKIGTCNCYSAAFAAMMRRIGLECYVLSGVTSASAGGMTGHIWTVIEIDGATYIFDPQVEDAIANRTSSKEIQYIRFGLPVPHFKYVCTGRSQERQMELFREFLDENGMFLVQGFVASPMLP